jgi:hypothetical protein
MSQLSEHIRERVLERDSYRFDRHQGAGRRRLRSLAGGSNRRRGLLLHLQRQWRWLSLSVQSWTSGRRHSCTGGHSGSSPDRQSLLHGSALQIEGWNQSQTTDSLANPQEARLPRTRRSSRRLPSSLQEESGLHALAGSSTAHGHHAWSSGSRQATGLDGICGAEGATCE